MALIEPRYIPPGAFLGTYFARKSAASPRRLNQVRQITNRSLFRQ